MEKLENLPVDAFPDDAVGALAQPTANLVLLPDVGVDVVRDRVGHLPHGNTRDR